MGNDSANAKGSTFYPELRGYLVERIDEFATIDVSRRSELERVSFFVRTQLRQSLPAKLTFICTHNSRRSHLSQVWAQVAADYYGIQGVETFSGGTEATAFNPRAVAALIRTGLRITTENEMDGNPHYEVRTHDDAIPQICFSKVYDAPPNPTRGYCAVMTCAQADDACPLVMGCDLRIPIRYEDPKIGDGTEREASLYDERSRQICREMLYMMSKV